MPATKNRVISDEQITDMYWERNELAIEETDKKYGKHLYRLAYNILCDKFDCEECKNDTYLGVWNAIPPTRPAVFSAFITSIMRNIAINRYKVRSRKKRIPSELTNSIEYYNDIITSDDHVYDEYIAKELGKIISEYVRNLSKKERYIFISRFYMAEPIKIIADDLHLTPSTIYKSLDKIKKGLRSHLERNGTLI